MIRPFAREDLRKVSFLHLKTFGNRKDDSLIEHLSDFYEKVFLRSPFVDKVAPSLVYEKNGEIEGFLGVLIRKFYSKKNNFRIGIGSRMMVSPNASALVGARLLRSACKEDFDLFFSDGANDDGRNALVAMGGEEVPIFSFHWLKLFKPFQFLTHKFKKRKSFGGFCLKLLAPVLDTSLRFSSSPFSCNRSVGFITDYKHDNLLDLYAYSSLAYKINPVYSKGEIDWLVRFCLDWESRGRFLLRKAIFPSGESGGFCGYLRPDGIFEVLNLWATKKNLGNLLDSIFYFVKNLNGVGVQGVIGGGMLKPLRERNVFFKKGSWAIAKSTNESLLYSLHSGQIYMGGFEGELWLPSARFGHG